MKSIYKITNNITNKIYIGQSNNPKSRFNQHMKKHSSSKGISEDVDKYGISNFSLEIIEENVENFQEREIYWINYYKEKGYELYNKTIGGEEPPTFKGEESPCCKFSDEKILEITNLILNTNYNYNKIAKLTDTTSYFVRRVNNGERLKIYNFDYPLRKESHFDKIAKLIVNDLAKTNDSQSVIANRYGVARSMVTMINIGKNHYNKNFDYPIRKEKV